MKKVFYLIGGLLLISTITFAQRKLVKNEWSNGLLIGLDYNIYHQYTRPSNHKFAAISNQSNSASQPLNVLPGIRFGLLWGVWHTYEESGLHWHDAYHFSIEVAFNYMPFSQNAGEYKGVGGINIPITIGSHFEVGDINLACALGVQFSKIEMNIRPTAYQGVENPYFMTYIAEFGVGNYATDYGFMAGYQFFSRIGFHPNKAMTIDIGVRGSITVGSSY